MVVAVLIPPALIFAGGRFRPDGDGHVDAAVHAHLAARGGALVHNGTGRKVAVGLRHAADAQVCTAQAGHGVLLAAQADQVGHRAVDVHLLLAHVHDHLGAAGQRGAGLRLGADHGAHGHAVVHGQALHHRKPLLPQGLHGLVLAHVGHVLHLYPQGAQAHLQGDLLARLHGAGGLGRLAVNVALLIVGVVLLHIGDGELFSVIGIALHIGLAHAHKIHQVHILPVAEQGVGGVGEDQVAQHDGADQKRHGHACHGRDEVTAVFALPALAGGRFRGGFRGRLALVGTGFCHGRFTSCLFVLSRGPGGGAAHRGGGRIAQIFVLKLNAGVLLELADGLQHGRGALVAVPMILGHGLAANFRKARRQVRHQLAQGHRLIRDLLDGHRNRTVRLKRELARKHLIHHHAHRVNVGGGVGRHSLGLLRADVMHRADGLIPQGIVFRLGEAGNAEIHQLDLTVGLQHDVLRLYVPMHHALAVGVAQRLQHLGDEM